MVLCPRAATWKVPEHRFPDEKPELFTSMAAELVSLKPDVLVGVGAAAPYLKKATSTIPVVFMYVPDPVGASLVETIRRPGGNATGLTNFSVELSAKRLQYLKEIMPSLSRVALLINPNAKISSLYVSQSNEAAPKLGLTAQAFEARSVGELDRAFDAMARGGAGSRRLPVVRGQSARDRTPRRRLRRSDLEGREARRHAGGATDTVRADHQHENGKSARPHHPDVAAVTGG